MCDYNIMVSNDETIPSCSQSDCPVEAVPVHGNEIEYAPLGAELERVRIRFSWNGKEYESTIIEEFLNGTQPIPESERRTMPHAKRYEVRAIIGEPPEQGPQPLDAPILVTNDVAEAKRWPDAKRSEYSDGLAIVDRIASTVIIVNREFGAADLDRLNADPLPLIPRYFQLR